jgi:hypothetical protein
MQNSGLYEIGWSEREAICILRIKAVQLRERAEFLASMGDSPSADKLEKTATVCTEKILDIVLESMFRHDAKRTEKALDHYSEMYDHEECDTLRKTILTFCVDWGLGKDPDMLERVDDLEEEIAICYEEVKEEEEDELS